MLSNLRASTKVFLVVLVFAELTCAFEASMIYAALATLFQTYGDPVGVGWLVTAFLLVSAAAAAVVGRLGDIFGRTRLLIVVMLIALVGSLVSAFSESLNAVIAGRALQGVSAAILPLCYGLTRERVPVRQMPMFVGIIAGTATLGVAFGYIVGGMIVDHWPWRTLFIFSSALTAFGALLCWLLLEPSKRQQIEWRIDIAGGLLFVPAVTALLYAITQTRHLGWSDPGLLAIFCGSVLVLAFWVRYELRHKNPLIDVRLFANREILAANLAFACMGFGILQSQMIILPLMQQPEWTGVGLGASAAFAGSLKGGATLLGAVGGPWAGMMVGRHGGRYALLVGSSLTFLVWATTTFYHGNLWFLATAGILATVGAGVIYGSIANLIVEAAPRDRVSEATGLSAVVRAVAGALGAQLIALILASSTVSDPGRGGGAFPTGQAYTTALFLVAAASLLCFIFAYALLKPGKRLAQA